MWGQGFTSETRSPPAAPSSGPVALPSHLETPVVSGRLSPRFPVWRFLLVVMLLSRASSFVRTRWGHSPITDSLFLWIPFCSLMLPKCLLVLPLKFLLSYKCLWIPQLPSYLFLVSGSRASLLSFLLNFHLPPTPTVLLWGPNITAWTPPTVVSTPHFLPGRW